MLLGAGFDSRAYRLRDMEKVTVFEVDHPATSGVKMKLTSHALGMIPENVRFVQTDFNQAALEPILKNAGYEASLGTLFVWEGVSNYLTPEAVNSTLAFCSKAAVKSRVIFTYIDRKVLEAPQTFYGTERVARLLEGVGEKWTFGFDPKELEGHLKRMGLALEMDLGADEYRKRYFKRESEKMKGYEFYRVASARVMKK